MMLRDRKRCRERAGLTEDGCYEFFFFISCDEELLVGLRWCACIEPTLTFMPRWKTRSGRLKRFGRSAKRGRGRLTRGSRAADIRMQGVEGPVSARIAAEQAPCETATRTAAEIDADKAKKAEAASGAVTGEVEQQAVSAAEAPNRCGGSSCEGAAHRGRHRTGGQEVVPRVSLRQNQPRPMLGA